MSRDWIVNEETRGRVDWLDCDFTHLAVPGVAGLTPYHPGKPIEELKRELGLDDVIKLASNENPLGPGALASTALRELPDVGRYPDGSGHALRTALAEHHGVHADQITLGNGSNDVLDLVARTFVGPGDEVVFSEHAFAVYPLVTQAVGGKAVVTAADGDYGHDLRAMAQAVTERTKVMFVANPNNPTGTWSTATQLRELIESLPDHVMLVIDEAYFEYAQAADYPNASVWVSEVANLIVTRTFSKAHGLAGLRIGYGLSHPQVAELLNRVRQPFNVNTIAMHAALAALHDREHVERSLALNRAGMQQLVEGLESLGVHYLPSLGNFICIDLEQPARPLYETLLRRGVIVRPIENYGMPNHLRVTVGLEMENARFLDTLAQVLGT